MILKTALLLLVAVPTQALASSNAVNGVVMRKVYVDGSAGQVHARVAEPVAAPRVRRAPIVLFHETPVSSVEYETLMAELAKDRTVIAVDTPGYGMSSPPRAPLDIAGYVAEIGPALQRLGVGGPRLGKAVVFGFHTGAVLAAETALSRAGLVKRVVLAGFPYRTQAERQERLASLPRDADAAAYREKVIGLYDLAVTNGAEDVPTERRVQLFAEMMLAGRRHWFGYDAVWRYDYEKQLPRISQPTLFLAPHEMLLEQTRAASRLVPGAKLVELPQAKDWALERNAAEIAAEIRRFADEQE
jgi:pimeloyl-ACP methyl ester carboxylesterase